MLSKKTNLINDFYIFNNKLNANKNALILLHGYGSSKEDFKDLIPFFNTLNDTLLVIPNAPFICDSDKGYKWFDVEINDLGIHFDMGECKQIFTILKFFIDKISNEHNIPFKNIGIFGFSQGAVMALSLAIFSEYKYGCIISHSGLFFDYNNSLKTFNRPIRKDQNILLIHGKNDIVIPFFYFENTSKFFIDNDIKFSIFLKDSLGHNVDKTTILETIKFFQLHCS